MVTPLIGNTMFSLDFLKMISIHNIVQCKLPYLESCTSHRYEIVQCNLLLSTHWDPQMNAKLNASKYKKNKECGWWKIFQWNYHWEATLTISNTLFLNFLRGTSFPSMSWKVNNSFRYKCIHIRSHIKIKYQSNFFMFFLMQVAGGLPFN